MHTTRALNGDGASSRRLLCSVVDIYVNDHTYSSTQYWTEQEYREHKEQEAKGLAILTVRKKGMTFIPNPQAL